MFFILPKFILSGCKRKTSNETQDPHIFAFNLLVMLGNYKPPCIVTIKMETMQIMVFIVEAGELDLMKIRTNYQNYFCYHKNGNNAHMQCLIILIICLYHLIFNILDDNICQHTCCKSLFLVFSIKLCYAISNTK